MDPVTIVGLVSTLIQIAYGVVSNLNAFYRVVRDMPTQSKVREELNSLLDMLADVRELLPNTPIDAIQQTELDNLYRMLTNLSKQTTPKSTNLVIRGITWPFHQAENLKIISKLEHFKTILTKILNRQQTYIFKLRRLTIFSRSLARIEGHVRQIDDTLQKNERG